MRCQECNYPLWNLKARQCPECGTPFNPREREFVVNSVRFCCPHCDQPYYGTGENGHLEPAEFECVQCAKPILMDEMVLRPADGLAEQQTTVDRVPWLDRRHNGWVKSWFRTIGMSMTAPIKLMRSATGTATSKDAWTFALSTWAICFLTGVALPILIVSIVATVTNGSRGLFVAGAAILWAGIGVVVAVLQLLIWGLITHGMLRITGGCSHTLGRTYQSLCWSVGPLAVIAVPCIGPYCGSYVGGVWQIVVACIMVMVGQGVHGGRATLAVLTAPVIGGVVFVVGYAAVIALFLSGMPVSTMTTATSTGEIQPLVDSVLQYGSTNDGVGPHHALQLVHDGQSAYDMVMVSSSTRLADVPVGDSTLDQVILLQPNRKGEALQAVFESMPEDMVAHRCGDFVFTYHGIDLTQPDARLWLVIGWPDPDAGNVVNASTLVTVASADGSSTTMSADALVSALAEQNSIRMSLGLAPLPGPDTVLHGTPARAP